MWGAVCHIPYIYQLHTTEKKFTTVIVFVMHLAHYNKAQQNRFCANNVETHYYWYMYITLAGLKE